MTDIGPRNRMAALSDGQADASRADEPGAISTSISVGHSRAARCRAGRMGGREEVGSRAGGVKRSRRAGSARLSPCRLRCSTPGRVDQELLAGGALVVDGDRVELQRLGQRDLLGIAAGEGGLQFGGDALPAALARRAGPIFCRNGVSSQPPMPQAMPKLRLNSVGPVSRPP